MYIIIAGGGIVGKSIVKHLAKDHDVIVIEKDKSACEKIYAKYGAVTINGDATNIVTLKEAGIEKCDYALGVMRFDAQNLLFSLLAKNFGVENIFIRMRNPEYKEAYEIAGATNIISSVEMMATKFVLDIRNPEVRKVASLRDGKADVSIITIPDEAACAGKTISTIVSEKDFPDNCVIAGIFDQRKDKFIMPRGDTTLETKNQVFLVAPEEGIIKAYAHLKKTL